MKAKIRHTGLVVKDLEASKVFYERYFGFKVQKEMDEYGDFIDQILGLQKGRVITCKMSDASGQLIELLKFLEPSSSSNEPLNITQLGITHIALTVENLDTLYTDLRFNEVEFINPPKESPDGSAKVAFCRDPGGVFLELVEPLDI